MKFTPPQDKRIARLIDANLDRAREGLRVIEDWCRFGLERRDLVLSLKDWRHQLSQHHHEIYKQARSSSTDQGALINHPAQAKRDLPNDVVSANCSRIQEALRVLEEFTRKSNPDLAKIAAIIRYEIYQVEISILQVNNKKRRQKLLDSCSICLITSPKKEIISIISSALKSGVKMVQYRCKESKTSDKKKLSEANELASLCKKHEALFIINDRVDIALATDADGVHLGQDDIPTHIARQLIGEEKLIGRSTHNIEQIKSAENENCDYIGLGPIFSSKSKHQEKVLGVSLLKEAYNETKLPLFAIGGIDASNVNEINSTGTNKIAVINAIINQEDPGFASQQLLKKLL